MIELPALAAITDYDAAINRLERLPCEAHFRLHCTAGPLFWHLGAPRKICQQFKHLLAQYRHNQPRRKMFTVAGIDLKPILISHVLAWPEHP